MKPLKSLLYSVLCCMACIAPPSVAQPAGDDSAFLVFILDGLRPGFITSDVMPNLHRLQQEGVAFSNSHAIFPTVTRVNAAALSTGSLPGSNGLVSNNMYVEAVVPGRSFSTGNYHNLLKLRETGDGRVLSVPTLAERLHAAGKSFVAISSGSTGSAFLLNPKSTEGVGVLINGYLEEGKRVAFPDRVNHEIMERFSPAPPKEDPGYNAAVDWTERVLIDYVIPELKPDVIFNWLTEPDHTQHDFGSGSDEVREVLRNCDRNIGLVLEKLREEGLYERTNIIVTSDHGFSLTTRSINLQRELIEAGLKDRAGSADVVTASSGQSVLIHVKNRDKEHIRAIVQYLQHQEWADLVFTMPADSAGGKSEPGPHGWVEGTFSLELIGQAHPSRGADILLTFSWTSGKNRFGYPGTQVRNTDGKPGLVDDMSSTHGGISPWVIRNGFLARGPAFRERVVIRNPVSNIDIAPTILNWFGIAAGRSMDGRVIGEALKNGPDYEKIPVSTAVYHTETRPGTYRALLQVSRIGDRVYVDKGWRLRN